MSISDVINAQAESLIVEAITAKDPDIDLRPGTPQYDLFVAHQLPPIAEIVDRLNEAETNRTTVQWASLSNAEVEAWAARFFTTRQVGAASTGTVRLKFRTAVDVALGSANVLTQNSLTYHPAGTVAVAKESLQLDPVFGVYTADIAILAESNGTAYDAPTGVTFTVDAYAGDPNFAGAIAVTPIRGGLDDESNEELVVRARKGQYVRNLINVTSVDYRLREQFGSLIQGVATFGMQDPEMLRDLLTVIDAKAGVITIHLGNHSDIYVKTPITRAKVQIPVPANSSLVDLSPWCALLKIHSVQDAANPTVSPFYSLINQDPKLRYSARDPVKLFVDPASSGRTLVVDLSYCPDILTIDAWVNGPDAHITLCDILVRSFVPVWLSGNLYVDGGADKVSAGYGELNAYIDSLEGQPGLIVSKLTEALHVAGIKLVHQDFEVLAQIKLGDGSEVNLASATMLQLPDMPASGFTSRIATWVPEGLLLTALS